MPIRAQLQVLLERANENRGRAEKAVKRLKPNQLTWTPGRDRWTVAQILDHLNRSAEQTLPRFEEALRGASSAGDEREQMIRYRFGERVFLAMVGPNAPVKIPVPPIFEPEASPNATKVVKRFFEDHDQFARVIEKSDAFRLRDLRVASPVTSKLRPGFVPYLDGMINHESYHLGQIEALVADVDFPK